MVTKSKITHHPVLSFRIYYTIQEFRKSQDGFPYVNKLLLSCKNIFALNLLDPHFDYFYFNRNSKLLPITRDVASVITQLKLIVFSDLVKISFLINVFISLIIVN